MSRCVSVTAACATVQENGVSHCSEHRTRPAWRPRLPDMVPAGTDDAELQAEANAR